MENQEVDLQGLAEEILESIEAGDDYYEEYQKRFCEFVGWDIEAVRSLFEGKIEDVRDYSEPNHEDWDEFFGKIDKERHGILIEQPSLARIEDLRIWIESNEDSAYECFCGAAGIPLTSDESGPIVLIGTMGSMGEYEIFLVSDSRKGAEVTWAKDWI